MVERLIVVVLMGVLFSCANREAYLDLYKNPSFANPAKLYLDVPYPVNISFFSDENCTLGKHGTRVVKDEKNVVFEVDGYLPRYAPFNRMQVVELESGVPQVINLTWQQKKNLEIYNVQGFAMCSITYKFVPFEHHKYVAVYQMENRVCKAAIYDLSQSHNDEKPVVANGLALAEKNCDIHEYYPAYRSR